MRILVSIDYEGTTGTAHWKEPIDFQKRMMTEDAVAIATGLKGHSVLINDAHATGLNLIPDLLPENCELIRGGPRPYGMMEGVCEVDGVILAGYHGGGGLSRSPMDHTYSSRTIYRLVLNGEEMDETLLNTYLAGYFKKSVIMVTGEENFIKSLKEKLDPGVEYVVTKYGVSRFSVRTRPAETVRAELKEKAKTAVSKLKEISPILPDSPYELEIHLADTTLGDLLELIPSAERISGRVIRFREEDYLNIYKKLRLGLALGFAARYYRD